MRNFIAFSPKKHKPTTRNMKNKNKLIGTLAAAAMIGGAGMSLAATTIQVDFGAIGKTNGPGHGTYAPGPGDVWNGVEPGNSGANLTPGSTNNFLDLVDSNGATTSVDLALTWPNSGNGLDFCRAWDLDQQTQPADLHQDYIGIRADNSGNYGVATVSSLPALAAGESYTVTVWSNSPVDLRVNGGTVVLATGNSTSPDGAKPNVFSGVTLDGSGNIVLDWGHITSNYGANQWTTITSMTVATVPEPTSVLLGLAGLVFFVRRRK
jgi:hypothetical protein